MGGYGPYFSKGTGLVVSALTMLIALHIKNFALIDQLDLQLKPGLNVITGETGAGKSIILDAIDAVLGGRASQRLIRAGVRKALVEAHFTMTPQLVDWLTEQGLPADIDKLACSRELNAGKSTLRSRFRVNGVGVSKPQMEALRRLLVEITAQGQTLQVGSLDLQREWLDGFGGENLLKQRQLVCESFEKATQARQSLERRRRFEAERLQQLDLFEYQCRELNAANLENADELDDLLQEQQRLSHSVELQQQSYQAYQILYENDHQADACADLLGKAETLLSDMLNYDPAIEPILNMVSDSLAQVEEAGRLINTYGETLETDPVRLEEVEQRIRQLKSLSRKYEGRTLAQLIEYRDEIQASLEAMNGDGQSLDALEATYADCQQTLESTCKTLSQLRQQSAAQFERQLIASLKPLAMEQVQFKVSLQPIAPTQTGADRIEFLFSPNPGEPLQSLAETASGGEMSRFLLGLKSCITPVDQTGTLVFDEIDVGVSGRVAQAIAEKLSQIAQQRQVLCVTHQPMVAAMADAHFRVSKEVIDTTNPSERKSRRSKSKAANVDTMADTATAEAVRTVVRVLLLNLDERREELAQLAGGHSHQEALTFAEALLNQAEELRQTH